MFDKVCVVLWQDPESPEIHAQLSNLCASRGHHLDLIEQLEAESEIEATVTVVEQGSYFECPPGVLADVSGVLTTVAGSSSVLWHPSTEPDIKVEEVHHRQEHKQEERLVLKPQGTFVRECGYEGDGAGQLNSLNGGAVALGTRCSWLTRVTTASRY